MQKILLIVIFIALVDVMTCQPSISLDEIHDRYKAMIAENPNAFAYPTFLTGKPKCVCEGQEGYPRSTDPTGASKSAREQRLDALISALNNTVFNGKMLDESIDPFLDAMSGGVISGYTLLRQFIIPLLEEETLAFLHALLAWVKGAIETLQSLNTPGHLAESHKDHPSRRLIQMLCNDAATPGVEAICHVYCPLETMQTQREYQKCLSLLFNII